MSRSTHDIECFAPGCGYKGKVTDDSIVCPKCGASVEGVALTGDALEAMMLRIRVRQAEKTLQSISKEAKG